MDIIKQLSNDKLKQIYTDGILWNEYSADQKYRSFLYKITNHIQAIHGDSIVLVNDVLCFATEELFSRQKNKYRQGWCFLYIHNMDIMIKNIRECIGSAERDIDNDNFYIDKSYVEDLLYSFNYFLDNLEDALYNLN